MIRLCLVLVVAFLGACAVGDATPRSSEVTESPVIEVVRLAPSRLDVTLRLPGELSPYEAVDVRARVTGFVSTISVDRGSKVAKDEVLVRLRVPELAAQRLEAQARARVHESTYARLREAAETPGAIAEHEVDIARTTLDAEKARAASLEALEGYATMRAPFAGIVTRRNVHPGALVSPGDTSPLLRLEDVARLRLTVSVPEHASGALATGATVGFNVSAYPGVQFSGQVQRSAGSLDSATRSLPVEVDVANTDGRLTPGSYAEVAWPVHRDNTFVVPRTAIVQTSTRLFVVCVRDGKAVRVDVRRGLSTGDVVEVFGELREGDLVIKRASEDLAEGTLVRTS